MAITIQATKDQVKAFCMAIGTVCHPSVDAGKNSTVHACFTRFMQETSLVYFAKYEAENGPLPETHELHSFLTQLRKEYGPSIEARFEQAKAEQADKAEMWAFLRELYEKHKAAPGIWAKSEGQAQ